MTAVNLLPRHRVARRVAERCVRRWIVAGAAWFAMLALASILLVRSSPPEKRGGVAAEIAATEAKIAAMRDEAAATRRTIAELARSKAAAQATTDHPDWSLLLARVIAERPTGLRFTRWELVRLKDALVLRMDGDAPDVAALTSFVMRLERLGAFRRVSLLSAKSTEQWAPTTFAVEGILAEGQFQ